MTKKKQAVAIKPGERVLFEDREIVTLTEDTQSWWDAMCGLPATPAGTRLTVYCTHHVTYDGYVTMLVGNEVKLYPAIRLKKASPDLPT